MGRDKKAQVHTRNNAGCARGAVLKLYIEENSPLSRIKSTFLDQTAIPTATTLTELDISNYNKESRTSKSFSFKVYKILKENNTILEYNA